MGRSIRPFDRMRRLRNDVEYPSDQGVLLDADDIVEDIGHATAIVDLAERLVDEMSPF